MYELRATRYAEIYRLTQDSRYLLIKPFSTGHSYGCATACLRAGGCVVPYFSAGGSLGVFEENGITHVSLEPHSLKLILDRLPPDFTKPANLTVVCAGSALSDDLCRRALSRMATAVTDLFGCNEVGGVAIRRSPLDENFATVCADVDVEMVDERDVRVPDGEPGWLRMKSASMADGYIGEPELTAKFFRGGWFYPGDIAVADGPRRIKLVGRGDEIVSTPGGKKATSDLEAVVMQHLGGADVGVCTLPNEEGIQEIHVAVAGGSLGQQDLLARVNGAFASLPIGRFYVVVLPTIPRNAVGKLQRARLKEMVAAAMGRR
jgi:acyl-coenzyme A synthetase/AMP-(fatty) acid ligase